MHDGLRLDTPDALVRYMLPDAPVHDPRHFEALLGVSKEEMGYFGPISLDFRIHFTSRMISRGVPGEFPTEGSVVAPKIRFFPKTANLKSKMPRQKLLLSTFVPRFNEFVVPLHVIRTPFGRRLSYPTSPEAANGGYGC